MHTAKNLLGTVAGILEGEIHRHAGDLGDAIRSFEKAVEAEDDLVYDEPEPLPFAARHWLGAALLDAKRYADAERVYRKELENHPHNGWSLFGLRKALTARGITAAEVDQDFAASWSRADAWIQASRY
jgi:tetratricopeptide (TPR) repeat protein